MLEYAKDSIDLNEWEKPCCANRELCHQQSCSLENCPLPPAWHLFVLQEVSVQREELKYPRVPKSKLWPSNIYYCGEPCLTYKGKIKSGYISVYLTGIFFSLFLKWFPQGNFTCTPWGVLSLDNPREMSWLGKGCLVWMPQPPQNKPASFSSYFARGPFTTDIEPRARSPQSIIWAPSVGERLSMGIHHTATFHSLRSKAQKNQIIVPKPNSWQVTS